MLNGLLYSFLLRVIDREICRDARSGSLVHLAGGNIVICFSNKRCKPFHIGHPVATLLVWEPMNAMMRKSPSCVNNVRKTDNKLLLLILCSTDANDQFFVFVLSEATTHGGSSNLGIARQSKIFRESKVIE